MSQKSGSREYEIRWKNGSTQLQEITHMFGRLTKKRALHCEDSVLALAEPSECKRGGERECTDTNTIPCQSVMFTCLPSPKGWRVRTCWLNSVMANGESVIPSLPQ